MTFIDETTSGRSPNKRTPPSNAVDKDAVLELKVVVEATRFAAYLAFWFMCGFAIVITQLVTRDILLAGPAEEGNTCPPFDLGKGFDIRLDSHLMRIFKFNNICVNWDYTPSRELTAMVYPLFEYLLLIYLSLDFLDSWVAYKKGYVSQFFFRMHCLFFPIMIFLCSMFRMIFVVIAYVNVQGHTAGFLCLQLALVMVVLYNAAYALERGVIYKSLGTLGNTRTAIWTYVIGDLLISSVKLYLTSYVVATGTYPGWAGGIYSGKAWGEWVDMVWMLFNAVAPLIISFTQARTEMPLIITIDQDEPEWEGSVSGTTEEKLAVIT